MRPGFPKPEIAWTKDGAPIKRHLGTAKMQKWSLELEEATTYDSGNYTCTVTNAHGTASFTYRLLIQGKRFFFLFRRRTFIIFVIRSACVTLSYFRVQKNFD